MAEEASEERWPSPPFERLLAPALADHEPSFLMLSEAILTSSGPRRFSRPELGDSLKDITDHGRSAEINVNAPQYRRRSSTLIDGIHDHNVDAVFKRAPAQLYSTMSGHLFHSGRIAIVLVGPPARGKTHISVSLSRFLSWLGVKTRIFHLGDYRRATLPEGIDVPDDYFFLNAAASSVSLRQKILKKCREDIYQFFNHENGQVAIYDAVNPISEGRVELEKEFAKHDVQTLFLESYVDDERILQSNARNVKISSHDFAGMDPDEAAKLYLRRIQLRIPHFETMTETSMNWIKMINAGQSLAFNNKSFGYIHFRIVFYLMNLQLHPRRTYFARAGTSLTDETFKNDASLSDEGKNYAKELVQAMERHREKVRQEIMENGGPSTPLEPLTIWTSTRRRTVETAAYLEACGHKVRQRSQLGQLHPGICADLSEEEIVAQYPDEVHLHEQDPYHHRYPRAESYHDLAVRLEPIILELEREKNDLLVIAHDSVLKVLYGYLMACDTMRIPKLKFPRNEIIEVIPGSYNNTAHRIKIDNLPRTIIPASPEDIQVPIGVDDDTANRASARVLRESGLLTAGGAISPARSLGSPAVAGPPIIVTPQAVSDNETPRATEGVSTGLGVDLGSKEKVSMEKVKEEKEKEEKLEGRVAIATDREGEGVVAKDVEELARD